MWGEDPLDVNEAREKELSGKIFKTALDNGARMVRHYNTAQSAHDVVRRIMNNHPVVLQIQRELVDERKDFIDTAAGDSINRELKELGRRHQVELRGLRAEMAQALGEKDDEMRRELEDAKRELEEQVKKTGRASNAMCMNYTAEKERVEAKVVEVEREVRERFVDLDRRLQDVIDVHTADRAVLEREVMERERIEAEYKRQLADLTHHIQDQNNAFAAYRASLEQEMRELRDHVAIAVTIPPPLPPRPALCVKVALCSDAHDD